MSAWPSLSTCSATVGVLMRVCKTVRYVYIYICMVCVRQSGICSSINKTVRYICKTVRYICMSYIYLTVSYVPNRCRYREEDVGRADHVSVAVPEHLLRDRDCPTHAT